MASTSWHGTLGNPSWPAPEQVVFCEEENRPGYTSTHAHEWRDSTDVLRAKIELLSVLIEKSKRCVAYTGAGISVASGIHDYASKAKDSISSAGKRTVLLSPFHAQPTLAHHVLTALQRQGHLAHWVQQNHDGLPQKAGFPQSHLNEVHGAWYDPSNPTVPMEGELREDCACLMHQWAEDADLALGLGTSMSGMNADRVVSQTANRALKEEVGVIGSVIINLQKTQ